MSQSPTAPAMPEFLAALAGAKGCLNTALRAALFGLSGEQQCEALAELRELGALRDAAELELLAALADGDVAESLGAVDTAAVLRDVALVTPGKARHRASFAGQIREPQVADTRAALRAGELDFAQATVVVSMVRALTKAEVAVERVTEAQTALLNFAADFDASELRNLARGILACLMPESEQEKERRVREQRGLTIRDRGDGSSRISGRVADADAALINACLDPLAAPRPQPDGTRDPRSADTRRLDALLEVCGYGMRHGYTDITDDTGGGDSGDSGDDGPDPDGGPDSDDGLGVNGVDTTAQPGGNLPAPAGSTSGGPVTTATPITAAPITAAATTTSDAGGRRTGGGNSSTGRYRGGPQLLVTCDLDALTGHTTGQADGFTAGPQTINHIPLTRASFERLVCDATVRRLVLDPAGVPLDVGRKSRTVTPAIRAAVIFRDRICTFPDCSRPPTWCDAHHCTYWTRNGPTSLSNIALACSYHHDKAHHGWEVRIGTHGRAEWRAPYRLDPHGTWHINRRRQPRNPFDPPLIH